MIESIIVWCSNLFQGHVTHPLAWFAGIPIFAALLGTMIGTYRRIGPKGHSHLQHLAAGIIFSVVSVEILPDVIHRQRPLLLTIGFSTGVAFMMILEKISGWIEGHEGKKGIPYTLLVGVGVDLFLDGLILALTLHALESAGRLLSLALAIELLTVGLTLSGTLRKRGIGRKLMFFLNAVVFSSLLLGAFIGGSVFPSLPEQTLDLVLSFGLAALLFLVTEELLVEPHREVDAPLSTVFFFAGFLAFLLLGQMHGNA